jgi:tripartite-type tricarboxylate transporter receptor subunit TctC
LRETIGQAMKDQPFVDAMEKIQTPITYMNAEAFQVFLDQNAKTIVETIRRIGKVG